MNSETLYNLDRPDEKSDLNFKDASQEEIIEATYKAWLGVTEELRKDMSIGFDYEQALKRVYRPARSIIKPFRQKLKGTISTGDLPFLREIEKKVVDDSGFYFSALLNETDLEKFSVGKLPNQIGYLGYWIKPDKTLEILKDGRVHDACWYSKGGTAINRGEIMTAFGPWSSDGTIINYGVVQDMGGHSTGGKFLNYGEVTSDFGDDVLDGVYINYGVADDLGGDYVKGGIFLNHGKVTFAGNLAKGGVYLNFGEIKSRMGWCCKGGVFVTRTEPEDTFLQEPDGSVYGIGPKQLKRSKKLSELMDKVEKASLDKRFDDVEKLARKVDEHVRANYEPRKIA